jgi:hypothetical protein
MIDYTEKIGPLPSEDIPLFTTARFQQELDRIFDIPVVADTFKPRETPLEGIALSKLIQDLGPVSVLGLEKGKEFI